MHEKSHISLDTGLYALSVIFHHSTICAKTQIALSHSVPVQFETNLLVRNGEDINIQRLARG